MQICYWNNEIIQFLLSTTRYTRIKWQKNLLIGKQKHLIGRLVILGFAIAAIGYYNRARVLPQSPQQAHTFASLEERLPRPGSKNNIAFLIVLAPKPNNALSVQTVPPFVKTAKQLFIDAASSNASSSISESKWNLYFFVFANNRFGIIEDKDIFYVQSVILSTEASPCQAYVDAAARFRFFDKTRFAYTFSVEQTMTVVKQIKISQIIGKRVAVAHSSFEQFSTNDRQFFPYDHQDSSCAYVQPGSEGDSYYATQFFGGDTGYIPDLCSAILSCTEGPAFHQIYNKILLDKQQPTRVLPADYAVANVNWYLKNIAATGGRPNILFLPPASLNTLVLTQAIQKESLLIVYKAYFEERRRMVRKVTEALNHNYINKISERLDKDKKAQFVSFRCQDQLFCEGFTSGIRGVIAAFYLALATRRVFYMDWSVPSGTTMSHYFETNAAFYDLKNEVNLNDKITQMPEPAIKKVYGVGYSYLVDQISNWSLKSFNIYSVVALTIDSEVELVEKIFRNPHFYPALFDFFGETLPEYPYLYDHSVITSAALRLLFSKPTKTVNDLRKSLVSQVGEDFWNNSRKIGIDYTQLVGKVDPTICFVNQIAEIVHAESLEMMTVFVRSPANNGSTTRHLERLFKQYDDMQLDARFIDSSHLASSDKSASTIRDIVDWIIITEVNWLLLSPESNFGETATIFSQIPTLLLKSTGTNSDRLSCYFSLKQ